MPAADTSGGEAAAPLRRSKRVEASDATSVAEREPVTASVSAPQRRSQRSARSALASPDAAKRSDGAEPANAPAAAGDDAAPPSPSARSSPLRRPRRVPTRRAAMRPQSALASDSPATADQEHEPLKDGALPGGHSAREAAALCEIIWQHLKENACQPDALEHDVSPAVIRWPRVAERLSRALGGQWTARACQTLWKFLAYGGDAATPASDDALLSDSDVEDYELSAQDVNRRVQERASAAEGGAKPAAGCRNAEPAALEAKAQGLLYPLYTQPVGVPAEWRQPCEKQQTTPLMCVAEKLLKRRVPLSDDSNGVSGAGPGELDASQRAIAAELRLSTEKPLPKAKRERKRKSDSAADRPRKKKDPVAVATAGPGPSPKVPTPVQPRAVFVPSSTPPPTPQKARDAFSYYCQMFRENHPAVVPSVGAVSESESPQSLLSIESLQILYARAAPHVLAACEQMAKTDVERYNREVLRVRLWEKTMASKQNSPAAALAPTPAAAPAAPAPAPKAPTTPVPPGVTSSATTAIVALPSPSNS
ncbi:hypothetical protein ATCC90586_005398 [Pythium insidiosum]|nr:hypothetical protein ATCC90586_005398 [Pythium insidiosum]